MFVPTTYEIVIRGRAGARILHPFLDDFVCDHRADDVTRLVGRITDPAQLHGMVAHLASMNAELISIAPVDGPVDGPVVTTVPAPPTPRSPTTQQEWTTT